MATSDIMQKMQALTMKNVAMRPAEGRSRHFTISSFTGPAPDNNERPKSFIDVDTFLNAETDWTKSSGNGKLSEGGRKTRHSSLERPRSAFTDSRLGRKGKDNSQFSSLLFDAPPVPNHQLKGPSAENYKSCRDILFSARQALDDSEIISKAVIHVKSQLICQENNEIGEEPGAYSIRQAEEKHRIIRPIERPENGATNTHVYINVNADQGSNVPNKKIDEVPYGPRTKKEQAAINFQQWLNMEDDGPCLDPPFPPIVPELFVRSKFELASEGVVPMRQDEGNKVFREEDIQLLIYQSEYDNHWKTQYTDMWIKENGLKRSSIANKAGWVLPLKEICELAGINPDFFVGNADVSLAETRAHVLWLRLVAPSQHSQFLAKGWTADALSNYNRDEFIACHLRLGRAIVRACVHNENVNSDRDQQRVHGQYYNNIYLGKTMFGPARRQKFVSTITGGMERRFEILDNQVNHKTFSHIWSDRNKEKCRNGRIKCNDETRIQLEFETTGLENSFIHANRISGGPLLNQFILTQTPMSNTIYDFWRMVWQEECPYIFMLNSRKDSRTTIYWPKHEFEEFTVGSFRLVCMGIDDQRDSLFRVTRIRIEHVPTRATRLIEHWQGNMNNADNLATPLRLLHLARGTSKPVVVHDFLGISRSACLVAIELTICSILRGPSYKHTVQSAVEFLRGKRPFSIETPIQFIFIHRVVEYFFAPIVGNVPTLNSDYDKWMEQRGHRMFLESIQDSVQGLPGHRLLSPRVDPDLLRLVRRPERPENARESASGMGELPLPLQDSDVLLGNRTLPNKYPRGGTRNVEFAE